LGIFEVNIDAGCFVDGQTCWSLFIRNHEGAVITGKTKIENVSMTPILSEVVGLRWCLNWIGEHKLQNIIVEMDAESMVKCVLGKLKLVAINLIVVDCLDLLSNLFNISLLCTKRCSNSATHSLVGQAFGFKEKEKN
jgi:ribonuclease HI